MQEIMTEKKTLSAYQKFLIAILAVLQFTIILDFMVMSPLGAQLQDALKISAAQFGLVVSAYGFSAGASGILTAGFADKFDRKVLLLFFYAGFIVGTLFCGIATTYEYLLVARVVTGVFGGVMSAIIFAIITDVFDIKSRGTVMGFVQMAFAASQVLGIPFGLYLANLYGWHSPFILIVIISVFIFFVILKWMTPVSEHLKIKRQHSPFNHFLKILQKKEYLQAFLAQAFLATGGFLLMPFTSTFLVNNVGVTQHQLPLVFIAAGAFTIVTGPLAGKISDKVGKYKVFAIGTVFTMLMTFVYTNMPSMLPLIIVMIVNTLLFIGISSRMISGSALMTAVPDLPDRGGFMNINSSIQQMAGGIAAAVGGAILVQNKSGVIENFYQLGYVSLVVMLLSIYLMFSIHKYIHRNEQ